MSLGIPLLGPPRTVPKLQFPDVTAQYTTVEIRAGCAHDGMSSRTDRAGSVHGGGVICAPWGHRIWRGEEEREDQPALGPTPGTRSPNAPGRQLGLSKPQDAWSTVHRLIVRPVESQVRMLRYPDLLCYPDVKHYPDERLCIRRLPSSVYFLHRHHPYRCPQQQNKPARRKRLLRWAPGKGIV